MAQGVVYQDANGSIFLANPAAEQLLGLSLDQMMGKSSMDTGWKAIRENGLELPGGEHPAMVSLRTGKKVGPFVMGVFNPQNTAYTWILVNATPLFQPGEATPFQVYTTFDDITGRKLAEQKILDAQQQIKELTFDLQIAEEHERSRIAGELHDQVGQRLLLAKMKLDMLAGQTTSSDKLEQEIEKIAEMVEQSIQDIRTLIFQMRPPLLATLGLVAAVRQLCIDIKEDYALEIEFFDDKTQKPLKYEHSTVLYRCVRELLLNVAKHAGTKQADLAMKRDGDTIVITVLDKGIGFNPFEVGSQLPRNHGFGLFNVQNKIEYLGGSFRYESTLGKGTRGTIIFPLNIS